MFQELGKLSEEELYDYIMNAWENAEYETQDADVVLSQLMACIAEEGKKQFRLLKTLTNSLILVLALFNQKPVDLHGENDVADLPPQEQEQVFEVLKCVLEG
jgi:hypothetical protein